MSVLIAARMLQDRPTAPATIQKPVDFNHPPRAYEKHVLQKWDVFVEQQLVDCDPKLAKLAIGRLEKKLAEVVSSIPSASLPDLRKLSIFILFGPKSKAGGRNSGLEFFQANAAQNQNWLDPRMAHSIVIYDAENYVRLSDLWAGKSLMHEFGHAQHLEHSPESRADIYDTWVHAKKAGLYQSVRAEDRFTHNPNYALQNHLEYFAELSAMYFIGCNYYPHNREQLKVYDPQGYQLVERIWGLRP